MIQIVFLFMSRYRLRRLNQIRAGCIRFDTLELAAGSFIGIQPAITFSGSLYCKDQSN
jgi:hypothetical protein